MSYNKTLLSLTFLALLAGLFAYVLIRAHSLSFTHDESLSYTIIKGNQLWAVSANNHKMNTFLMDVCSRNFGDQEWSLRLPNVLAFLLYGVFAFLLLKDSRQPLLMFFGAALLLFHPFLLDFFSLARGYGLSLGCMMVSLYFFLRRTIRQYSYATFIIDFQCAIVFAILAILANLSMVNFFIAILGVFVLQYLVLAFRHLKISLRQHLAFLSLLILAGFLFKEASALLFELHKADQLYVGEKSLEASLDALIKSILYLSSYSVGVASLAKYSIIAILLGGLATVAFQRFLDSRLYKILGVTLLIILGFVLEHHLFGANYPVERTALMFIPLFGLTLHCMCADWYEGLRPKFKIAYLAMLALLILLPITFHFASNLSWKYTCLWQYDAHTKDAVLLLEKLPAEADRQLSISNSALFEPAINYYLETRKIIHIARATRDPLNVNADFIYDFQENQALPADLQRIAEFEDIKTVLCKGKAATDQ